MIMIYWGTAMQLPRIISSLSKPPDLNYFTKRKRTRDYIAVLFGYEPVMRTLYFFNTILMDDRLTTPFKNYQTVMDLLLKHALNSWIWVFSILPDSTEPHSITNCWRS